MKTLYIDVYFLINFTVDLLSLYFGALFATIKSSVKRLIISSFISALFACFIVLADINALIYAASLILNAVIVTRVFCGKISFLRQLKLFLSFMIFETLIGGFVTLVYGMMDKYLHPLFELDKIGAENKNLIILAIIIVMAFAILRLMLIVFADTRYEKNAKIKIGLFGNEVSTEAFVDSGNFLRDPIDSSPVVIVKRSVISELIGNKGITEDERFNTKIRIIPTKTVVGEKIFIGFKSDYIVIGNDMAKFNNTVIVIDEEEGTFGGYSAILPVCFSEGIRK